LEPTLEANAESARHWTLYADACQREGRTRRAVRAIEKAVELAPEESRVHSVAARIDRDRGRLADALRAIERAIALDPERTDYHLFRGILSLEGGAQDDAVESFRRAHELSPDEPQAIGGYGRALVLVGRQEEGLPLLEEYLTKNPTDAEALYLRGLARFRDGELSGAEEDFRRAISVAPHMPGPYHNLARILEVSGRKEEAALLRDKHRLVNAQEWAIRAARREVASNPQDDEALRTLASLLTEAGRTGEAARLLAELRTP
jgi:Flp pilus assembly protein TadD